MKNKMKQTICVHFKLLFILGMTKPIIQGHMILQKSLWFGVQKTFLIMNVEDSCAT